MIQASSPKHARSWNSDEQQLVLPSLQFGDAASWVQAGIMASPVLAYACVYYVKHSIYSRFGLPSQLVTVRFEDVLVIAAVLIAPIAILVFDLVLNKLVGREPMGMHSITGIAILLLLYPAENALLVVSISFQCGIFDWMQYLWILIQLLTVIGIHLMVRKSWLFRDLDTHSRGTGIFLFVMLLLFATVEQVSSISFHNNVYQICDNRNTLIVGFDNQGKAIEKQIVSVSNNGVCELAPGYSLVDVSGDQLHVERYYYLLVDE